MNRVRRMLVLALLVILLVPSCATPTPEARRARPPLPEVVEAAKENLKLEPQRHVDHTYGVICYTWQGDIDCLVMP